VINRFENSFKKYIWILEEVTGKWERIVNPINIHSFNNELLAAYYVSVIISLGNQPQMRHAKSLFSKYLYSIREPVYKNK